MDFSYSEEQQLFSDSLRRLMADSLGVEQRHAMFAAGETLSDELWQAYAELGLFALPVAEADEGLGGNTTDVAIAAMEFGRALAFEPFLPSVILGGAALGRAGDAAQRARHLPGLMTGETRFAVALLEPQGRYDAFDVATRAEASAGDGHVLSGRKAVVLGGDTAQQLIVSARSGAGDVGDGLSLFLVPAAADGVTIRNYALADGRGAAEIDLDKVAVDGDAMLGAPGTAADTIEYLTDLGALFVAAEAIGAIERINELTLEYLRTREQFGRPIGRFQALQHRMVDMVLEYEHAKSLCFAASVAMDAGSAPARARAVSAAKNYIGAKGRIIAAEAVQLHGGIGVTAEYELGDYVKRVMVAEMLFGDADHHLERFGAIMAASPGGVGVWSA
jgi:alkylation response protein AidB-like acyl-CoA dehydrogenase